MTCDCLARLSSEARKKVPHPGIYARTGRYQPLVGGVPAGSPAGTETRERPRIGWVLRPRATWRQRTQYSARQWDG